MAAVVISVLISDEHSFFSTFQTSIFTEIFSTLHPLCLQYWEWHLIMDVGTAPRIPGYRFFVQSTVNYSTLLKASPRLAYKQQNSLYFNTLSPEIAARTQKQLLTEMSVN